MKKFNRVVCSAFVLLGITGIAKAQTPSDGLMMGKRQACLALTYEQGSFDQYWEGTYLRKNETITTVDRKVIMPMIAIGVIDNLNIYVAVPYVKTASREPNGGQLQGAKGFQDLSIAFKYRLINKEIGKGKLAIFAAGGFATPITNYLSDYRPYSLGNGTNEVSLRGIAQYRLNMGLYGRAMGGRLFRGQTQAERDFYYNNGAYYTRWMDVPSAWEYNVVMGMWFLKNSLRVEAGYYALESSGGDDIRRYNAAQPTNKVDFNQMSFSAQYYIPAVKGLGVLAYYSKMFNGRNIGQFTTIGAGVTYQFKF